MGDLSGVAPGWLVGWQRGGGGGSLDKNRSVHHLPRPTSRQPCYWISTVYGRALNYRAGGKAYGNLSLC